MKYSCYIGKRELTVHTARVSAVPYNTVWRGRQRTLDQTEEAYFVYFDMDAPTTLTVNVEECDIDKVDIRPLQYDIQCKREGNTLKLQISKPMNFTVEINGYHHALHVFANPKDDFVPDENTIYFGEGIHDAGLIFPERGQTVYIAEGAVVYGGIHVYQKKNVTICGRGILDASKMLRAEPCDTVNDAKARLSAEGKRMVSGSEESAMLVYNSEDVKIEGIIIRDTPNWAVTTRNDCKHIEIDNIKLIGMWRYNSDGVDFCTTSDAVLKNSFIRTFDDCIVVRGPHLFEGEDGLEGCKNIQCTNNVLWCDWGKNIEVWCGRYNCLIKNVLFSDNYCIHTTFYAISLNTMYGSDVISVEDVSFNNIYIDTNTAPMYPKFQDDLDLPYRHSMIGKNPTKAVLIAATKIGRFVGNQQFDSNFDSSGFKIKYKNIRFDNVSCTDPEVLLPIEIKTEKISMENITFINCKII